MAARRARAEGQAIECYTSILGQLKLDLVNQSYIICTPMGLRTRFVIFGFSVVQLVLYLAGELTAAHAFTSKQ